MSHEEDLARMRAEMDQAKEGLREFAGSIRVFYLELIEAGFTSNEAMALTVAWITAMLKRGNDDE